MKSIGCNQTKRSEKRADRMPAKPVLLDRGLDEAENQICPNPGQARDLPAADVQKYHRLQFRF